MCRVHECLTLSSTAFPLFSPEIKYMTMKLNLYCELLSLYVRGYGSIEKEKPFSIGQ